MVAILSAVVSLFVFRLRSRAALELKLVALQHQLTVLRRRYPGRPQLSSLDRLLWMVLYRICPRVLDTMALVKPATVVEWHRQGFRFYWRWRVEIKSVPCVPVSHPFVERLIGTIRREFLDRVLIWNATDLERKLEEFRIYYNENRVHQSLGGSTPGERSGQPPPAPAVLDHYAWRHHCRGLFQMPVAA